MKKDKWGMLIWLLPVATAVLLAAIFCFGIPKPASQQVMLKIGAWLLLLSNAYMFFLILKIMERTEQICITEKLYRKTQKENEQQRSLLHDMNKFLRTAAALVSEGENDMAMKLFEQLNVRLMNEKRETYCYHKIVNAILEEGREQAELNGIQFQAEITPEVTFDFLSDMDLISLLGNLLENAIEAACKVTEDKYVNVRIHMENEGHFLVMQITNNFDKVPILSKKRFATSKKNKKKHGIGLPTAKQIVESYKGKLRIEVEKQEFTVFVLFQIEDFDGKC